MECNKKFFHTINLKAAVALATLNFKMNKPPVTRLVRTDGKESTEFWFEGENDKGQDASQVYRQMTKEGDELEAKDPENPLCYIRAALANRDVLVDIIRNTPRLIEIEHNGKRIAISENASDKTKQEMTRFLITLKDCEKIVRSSKKILNAAIKVGGTTLKDFYSADGSPGYFKFKLNVYGREGLDCKNCKGKIVKANINKRATFSCPSCQS